MESIEALVADLMAHDDAASECRLVPLVGAIVPVPPATETIATCRQQFVLLDIETVAD